MEHWILCSAIVSLRLGCKGDSLQIDCMKLLREGGGGGAHMVRPWRQWGQTLTMAKGWRVSRPIRLHMYIRAPDIQSNVSFDSVACRGVGMSASVAHWVEVGVRGAGRRHYSNPARPG